ncbi:50S ribosomal protein L35 [Wohlfahrtiimonas chitiniclastica]|uniref:Large ribosomal subunit protein bL35 n=1 Tax=Wohlfahrtiimonas chitiniclastica TaxID=400946 RepID=A0A162DH61_9GAMM|nr:MULTISPECIES: 50S ribosomal protein L35 [Wohlfahrtiimonas]KZS23115.1 50S ribosomal protein L35 [Wohlfahrtiimonas chitiniclastica]MBS7814352.1 50S ribosomal protein L35 [Wohlfahrtiimonas chitiniclastica]MBS7816896.1 50S ribosomal protein L35 [Wohlfahrtiimonas chitiniclastica]MBS7818040.1 50S ribosomal protein L35 [Wohlfahrtiimonas chitiniclastica]MBS7820018.1 50S ribosomal protein L35 [Wohlfahrtiimonas chitiniclastica]
MPKMKSNSGAKKRFRKNGGGNFKRHASHRSHILTKKSTKRKRHLRNASVIKKVDTKMVNRMLPYA